MHSLHGMWAMEYHGDENYRLSLYSSIGTLEACLSFDHGNLRACKEGLRGPEALNALPLELLEDLPRVLLGRIEGHLVTRDKVGRTQEALFVTDRGVWRLSFRYYLEEEGFPYPTLVSVAGERVSLRIRIQEFHPGPPP